MERFPFSVRWSGSTATREYTRDAVAGAPGKVEIPLSAGDPAIGDLTRWNPEDLLGASLATCHNAQPPVPISPAPSALP